MSRNGRTTGLISLLAACLLGAGDPPAVAPVMPDFKLIGRTFRAGDTPIDRAEHVFHDGRVYVFRSSDSEVLIFDPKAGRVEMLDLKRKVRSSVSVHLLNDALDRLHRQIDASIARLEKKGGKANLVAAEMSRGLLDPRLSVSYDPARHRLHLKGSSAEVDATGEPEADAARLNLIASWLTTLVKLESLRDPAGIPPFTRLKTIEALAAEHKLRPAEMSFLFRQAGPPERQRWTYELVTGLTDREREALARITYLRTKAPVLEFQQYEMRRSE